MMKLCLLFACCYLSLPVWGQLTTVSDFGSNPGNLNMYMYVPKSANKYRPMPLLVALHGCSQDARELSEQSGWNELAERYGFIVLYPEQKRSNNVSRCFNWFRPEDIRFGGESASILQMIQYVGKHYTIRDSSVYTYGLSAGAAMSVSLLAQYPQTFAAGASLAGGPYGLAENAVDAYKLMSNPVARSSEELSTVVEKLHNDTALHYPRLVVLHGKNDKVVDVRNALSLVQQWSAILKCDLEAEQRETIPAEMRILKESYASATHSQAITVYLIDELGHSLPVDPGSGNHQGGKTGVFATDIGFYSTYYIALDLGLIAE